MERSGRSPAARGVLLALAVGLGWCSRATADPPAPTQTPPSAPTETLPAPTAAAHGSPPPALPIDLPTALALVNAQSPTIALARERVLEAYAGLRVAQVLWLPNFDAGPSYQRHDGRLQNSNGEILNVSSSNFFIGGGAAMRFQTAEAWFAPLIARRLVEAQAAQSRAVTDDVQLDVALTYLDLLQAYGSLAINADILARAEEIQARAAAADRGGVSRTKADVTRARTEVRLRQEERIELEGQVAVVSARLAQLLYLQPTTLFQPADAVIVPISLVSMETTLEGLVTLALLNRPELEESRALVLAALGRWRQAHLSPFLPRLELAYSGGDFGGGINNEVSHFGGRADGTAQALWELRNLGAGDVALARLRRSQYNQANFHVQEVQAQVAAEATAAAQLAQSRFRALGVAEAAVVEALETYRRLQAASFGIVTKEGLLNTLEPLIAEQTLAQARSRYLTQVIEYNRAQFRLYRALGQPPAQALAEAQATSVTVPVVPPPYEPPSSAPAVKP